MAVESSKVQVSFANEGALAWVGPDHICQRLVLPWRPRDLYDFLLIFCRRDGSKNDYVSDLRVRRILIMRLLRLFTLQGTWRQSQAQEPLHKYYGCSEVLSAHDIEDIFPEPDAVPDGLHFEYVEAEPREHAIGMHHFVDWLR